MAPRILFVFTSANKEISQGRQTGYWLSEAAHPYYILAPNFDIDFASPKKTFPVDTDSVTAAINSKDEQALKFQADEKVLAKQVAAKSLIEINANDYAAVFFVGGCGPEIDLATDPDCTRLVEAFWSGDKHVAAVCHGTAALVGARINGKSIFAGKKVTGFSNTEAEVAGFAPFLVENKIKELGGVYERAKDWEAHVVVDGRLITGQNPASAEPLAKKLSEVLT